jgi:hypothetical protein
MTDEQYLRARGWDPPAFEDDDTWTHQRHPKLDAHGWVEPGRLRHFTLAEAVETQLAEDRDCYNFVRARTRMHGGYLWPQEGPPDDIEANRPKEPR